MTSRLTCIPLLFLLAIPGLHAEDATDRLSRRAVDRFLHAYKASEVDAVMNLADVPWFHNAKEVIKDRGQLKDAFDKEMGSEKNRSTLQHKILLVSTYKSVREKLNSEERKLADEVVRENDRVVLVLFGRDVEKDKGDKVAFLVRIQDGQAKVVGLKD